MTTGVVIHRDVDVATAMDQNHQDENALLCLNGRNQTKVNGYKQQPASVIQASVRRMLLFKFKEDYSFELRAAESSKIRELYPERVPIVVEKVPGSSISDLQKQKFLVPDGICVDQFIWILKEKLSNSSDKEIHIYLDNQTRPDPFVSILQVYQEHKDDDGFLYVRYQSVDGNQLRPPSQDNKNL